MDVDGSIWHSIRPWIPPLSLIVREITSVSVTFILSASISLTALGLTFDDIDDDTNTDSDHRLVARALARGLSVDVDSSPWRRVIIRIDEKIDEAVIIVYGLMPGRQYDIDLELVSGKSVRKHIVTEAAPDPDPRPPSPVPAEPTVPDAPPPPPPITLEDRLSQLHLTLSALASEHTTLTTSLKSARKESQRSDAALKSEIDILKRTSDKNTASEARARQKTLALQEALKRTRVSNNELELEVQSLEDALPALLAKKEEKENEYTAVKADADAVSKAKDDHLARAQKRLDALHTDIGAINTKLDRLGTRKDKLTQGIIPDLEEQLRAVQAELDRVEGRHTRRSMHSPTILVNPNRHPAAALNSSAPIFLPGNKNRDSA